MSVHGGDRREKKAATGDGGSRPRRDEPRARLPQSPGDRGSRLGQIEECARHKGDVLERRLSRGVFLAYSSALGVQTVLRVDSPKAIARQAAVLRFLALHGWPGAPRYCGVWQSGAMACLRVEYIAGATALQLLLARSLTVDFLIDFQRRLARLLCSLHALGVVHLDVRPDNIAVRPDGTLCLLNWDHAQILSKSSRTHAPLFGGFASVAPEALSKTATDAHPALDVWSFGACLIVLLTGEVIRPTSVVLARLCLRLPPEFAGVVRGALTADPRQRPSFRQLCDKYFSLRAVNWSDELIVHVHSSTTDTVTQFPALAYTELTLSEERRRTRAERSPALAITAARCDAIALSTTPPVRDVCRLQSSVSSVSVRRKKTKS